MRRTTMRIVVYLMLASILVSMFLSAIVAFL